MFEIATYKMVLKLRQGVVFWKPCCGGAADHIQLLKYKEKCQSLLNRAGFDSYELWSMSIL